MFQWFNRKMRRAAIARKRRNAPAPAPLPVRKEPVISFRGAADHVSPNLDERLRNLLKPYKPPEHLGVIPKGYSAQGLAMDSAPMSDVNWAYLNAGANAVRGWLADGLGFMGYACLSEMAQRAEFRKPCTVLARECVREWIEFHTRQGATGDDKKDVAARIGELNKAIQDFDCRRVVFKAMFGALVDGLGHVWTDIKGVPIDVEGQNIPLVLDSSSDLKGRLNGFKVIEAVWTTPNMYNADSPLKDNYYRPDNWWVQGSLVHRDRIHQIIPYPVRQLLAPAFNFGGLSLMQMMRAGVHNFLRTRNSVANITSNFSKVVLKTDQFAQMAESGCGVGSLEGRVGLMNKISDAQDTFIIDKENEDASIIATPLNGLNDLQAQSMESMAGIPGIPLVKLFGIQPQGLNASSEGEIRVFYDEISSIQEDVIRPLLERMIKTIQLHLWGEIDPAIDFRFKPLWQESEKALAEIEKIKTETDALNIEAGIITAEEARERQNSDPDSIYSAIDLSGLPPEPPDEDEGDDDDLSRFKPRLGAT